MSLDECDKLYDHMSRYAGLPTTITSHSSTALSVHSFLILPLEAALLMGQWQTDLGDVACLVRCCMLWCMIISDGSIV
jgi:hypothetical protein